MHLPQISAPDASKVMTEVFYGYNHNLRMQQGESYDQKNMTSDNYPVLTQRKRRGQVRALTTPRGLGCKKQLAWVDGTTLYYAGSAVTGITLSAATNMNPKQLVSMGSYLVVWPDGGYYNTLNAADYGRIDCVKDITADTTFALCDGNFASYDMASITISDTAPANPENGQMWIDTSSSPNSLMQYSEYSAQWVNVPTVYVRISAPGIGEGFSEGDGVNVQGIHYSGNDAALGEQLEALNGDTLLQYVGDGYVVVTGIISGTYIQEGGGITISRKAPKMDYVIESNNRLWGCFFGMDNGESLNEIYCSKLGDFKNWRVYAGISTDSYAVSVGSDGPFTGAATYKNYPHFFKDDCVYQIYGTMPATYEVVHTKIPGVQRGCSRSLVSEGGYLYYKSPMGICRFDGSAAAYISDALGGQQYIGATAGTFRNRLMMSLEKPDETWEMFAYDIGRGMWSREDDTQALFWTSTEEDLYFVDSDGKLWCVLGSEGTKEDPLEWEVVSAPIGYEDPNQKYLSRFSLRMRLGAGSEAELYVMYDDDGIWRRQGGRMQAGNLKTYLLPVRPRRCDHIRWKLSGTGEVELYSVAKNYESGSDAV